jgi:hypothetical protein
MTVALLGSASLAAAQQTPATPATPAPPQSRPVASADTFRRSLVASNGGYFSDSLSIGTRFSCGARKVGGRLRCTEDPSPETVNLPVVLSWRSHPDATGYTVLTVRGRRVIERSQTTDTLFSTTISQIASGPPGVINRTSYRYRVLAHGKSGAVPIDSTNAASVRIVWSVR